MRTLSIATILLALLPSMDSRLEAVDSLRLETLVYVYRERDFGSVKLPGIETDAEAGTTFLVPPATASFDGTTLSLEGAAFAWSNGRNPPDRFSPVETPAIVLLPGQPTVLLSAAPVQYVEKAADGSLKVRDIPADSPDAPHCRLTFTVGPAENAGPKLRLTCDLELAMLSAREEIPGVTLDIGRPVLTKLSTKVEASVRIGDWSALVASAPSGSDYSLLMLLRIVPGGTPVAGAGTAADGRSMTPEELDRFATYYYLDPQPGRIDDAIRAFGASGFATERGSVFIGFFAAVFQANPDRVVEWRRTINQQDKDSRACLRKALRRNFAKSLLASDDHSITFNDACWGAFFASGDSAFLHKLVGVLKKIDSDYLHEFWVGATAEWSLARNAPEHPLVRATLRSVRNEIDPRTREIIDSLLSKDPSAIRQELVEIRNTREFLNPISGGPGIENVPRTHLVGDRAGDPKLNW